MSVFGFLFFGLVLLVVALYSVAPPRYRPFVLLAANVAFYTILDGTLPYVLAIPAVLDYLIARRIAATDDRGRKRRWLALSLAIDVSVLGFFKYVHFYLDSACSLLARFGVATESCHTSLALVFPLGISYFIFKSISAVFDVYRGKPAPARWLDYATYLSFFPQLVAGPIERFESFGPQLSAKRRASFDDVCRGVALILRGLFKKLVVANNVHFVASAVLDPNNGPAIGSLDAITAMYAFVWEMYADFSGYSDIANGVGALFGFKSVLNFNLPFFASRPSEFWKRWHISLSSWVNDYVLLGLVGIRARGGKLYAGVIASMFVIGVWHGPTLAFAIFGLFQGMLLVTEMQLRKAGLIGNRNPPRWRTIAGIVLTFHLFVISELLFATSSISQALHVLSTAFTGPLWTDRTSTMLAMFVIFVAPLALLELFEWHRERSGGVAGLSPVRRGLVYSAMVAAISLFGIAGGGVMYAAF